MDLRHIRASATAIERAAIDLVIGPEVDGESTVGLSLAKGRRQLLLPALHAAQRRVGYVSPGALSYISRRLHIPPAEAYGVLTFYGMFSTEARPPRVAHLCTDLVCRMRGAASVEQELRERLGPPGQTLTRAEHEATWLESPCLGLCEVAPAALVTIAGQPPFERSFGHASAESIESALTSGDVPRPIVPVLESASEKRTLRRAGRIDPESLDEYRAHGGFAALRKALELGAAWVVRELLESKLVGRGGAAFPTGRKWQAVQSAPVRPHYFVVNADESEPGTFKDRILMELDPFAIVEAATIGGFAVGADRGFIYVRGEYPLAIDRLEHAISESRRRGFLGEGILGKTVNFELEVRRGAGAYVCGEETALFASIEGFRGEPRNKPPFPVEVGLFGKPTAINNVETLANVLDIVRDGARVYSSLGSKGSTGTKLFCVSGDVNAPGLYEVDFGLELSRLIGLAGGPSEPIQTVLLGGAAGTLLRPDELDVELSFEGTREIGATLGSGVVVVIGTSRRLLELLHRVAVFFRDESCGQCVPCRVGTARIEELLERALRGAPLGTMATERAMFEELAAAMRDASICGLGQTAPSALESAIKKLGLFEETHS